MTGESGRPQGGAGPYLTPGTKAQLAAEAGERAMKEGGRKSAEKAAVQARLAQAYAAMDIGDRLKAIKGSLDALTAAIKARG